MSDSCSHFDDNGMKIPSKRASLSICIPCCDLSSRIPACISNFGLSLISNLPIRSGLSHCCRFTADLQSPRSKVWPSSFSPTSCRRSALSSRTSYNFSFERFLHSPIRSFGLMTGDSQVENTVRCDCPHAPNGIRQSENSERERERPTGLAIQLASSVLPPVQTLGALSILLS